MISRPENTPGRDSRIGKVFTTIALVAICLLFGGPFLWIVVQSLDAEISGALPWPEAPTLDNFQSLWDEEIVRTAFRNSVMVAGLAMVVGTIIASLAGFGLSRVRLRRKEDVMYGVILLYAIPLAVTMVAIFELAIRLDLSNNLRGLVIAEVAVMLPLLSWLMKGFYDAVPRQLDEAAMVDGGSIVRIWWSVASPAALPGIGVAAGHAFVIAWSDPLLPIVLISDPDLTTLSRFFFGATSAASSPQSITALGVVFMAPVLVVMLLLRRVVGSSLTKSIEER